VAIADLWGTEDVFRGATAASHAEAAALAQRLAATASVVEEPVFETLPAWK
jgi:hypothetical protein